MPFVTGTVHSLGDRDRDGMASRAEAGWESVDGVDVAVVETGADRSETRGRGIDVLGLNQPRDLRDIASVGLTLPEAKRLLAQVQQAVVAVQARDHAALRPACSGYGACCHVKDWQSRQVATLFGKIMVRLPRFRCSGCGRVEAGIN